MRTPQDLSVSDGDITLAELSKQYPALISTIGMATRIKNCYKKTRGTQILVCCSGCFSECLSTRFTVSGEEPRPSAQIWGDNLRPDDIILLPWPAATRTDADQF